MRRYRFQVEFSQDPEMTVVGIVFFDSQVGAA